MEFRHESWFNKERIKLSEEYNFIFVSADSQKITYITSSNNIVYLRLHGRSWCYSHYYTDEKLMEITDMLLNTGAEEIYIYFNSDHDMLENDRR